VGAVYSYVVRNDVMIRLSIACAAACFLAQPRPADAVILKHSIPRNTTPPTGELANAGWQYQAQFAGFLGTPISSKYFITAQHIGGVVGQDVWYPGSSTSPIRP
jgi:hypothetical protein